ncbi:MAG TPA: DUF502 domain-containing protein [Steroidobacteraceae bacterium]|nr:DUF502 domain-containing protein [Steroidobacteraceae bacterium]
MKQLGSYLLKAIVRGALIVVPVYLAILLLLKAAKSIVGLVQPIAKLLPDWFPAADVLSILLVLIVCFLIGALVHTAMGRAAKRAIEKSVLERVPGYSLFRALGQRAAGQGVDSAWQPALIEIEDALVPGFIVETIDDNLLTVFVPSVPTPFAGAIYIIERRRVHPVDVPFTQAIKTISRWGSGSKELVAAMKRAPPAT